MQADPREDNAASSSRIPAHRPQRDAGGSSGASGSRPPASGAALSQARGVRPSQRDASQAHQRKAHQTASSDATRELAAINTANLKLSFLTRAELRNGFLLSAELHLLKAISCNAQNSGLVVRNLHLTVSINTVKTHLSQFGEVFEVRFLSKEGGAYKDTLSALVVFRNLEDAQTAFEQVHNTFKEGISAKEPLYISYIPPSDVLNIGNLTASITLPSRALKEVFSRFGEILDVDLSQQNENRACLRFESASSALEAARALHSKIVPTLSGDKELSVSFATSSMKKARLQPQLPQPAGHPLFFSVPSCRKKPFTSLLRNTLVRVNFGGEPSLHFVIGTTLSEPQRPDGKQHVLLQLEGINELVPATDVSNGNPFAADSTTRLELIALAKRINQSYSPDQFLTVDEIASLLYNRAQVKKKWWKGGKDLAEASQADSIKPGPLLTNPEQKYIEYMFSTMMMIDSSRAMSHVSVVGSGRHIARDVAAFEALPVEAVDVSPMVTPASSRAGGSSFVTPGGSGRSSSHNTRGGRGGGGGGSRSGNKFTPAVPLPAPPGSTGLLHRSDSPPKRIYPVPSSGVGPTRLAYEDEQTYNDHLEQRNKAMAAMVEKLRQERIAGDIKYFTRRGCDIRLATYAARYRHASDQVKANIDSMIKGIDQRRREAGLEEIPLRPAGLVPYHRLVLVGSAAETSCEEQIPNTTANNLRSHDLAFFDRPAPAPYLAALMVDLVHKTGLYKKGFAAFRRIWSMKRQAEDRKIKPLQMKKAMTAFTALKEYAALQKSYDTVFCEEEEEFLELRSSLSMSWISTAATDGSGSDMTGGGDSNSNSPDSTVTSGPLKDRTGPLYDMMSPAFDQNNAEEYDRDFPVYVGMNSECEENA